MKFSENLIELRKRNNMTQEDLAEKLNVSRQTIYKWESGATYPDMDKTIDIAKMFNISVDQLINEEITEDSVDKEDIIKSFKKIGRNIGSSVLLILIGISILVFMSSFNDDTLSIIGTFVMLLFIFIAVIWIVFSSITFENFKKDNNLSISFAKKEIEKGKKAFTKHLMLGLISIFTGVLTVIATSITNDEFVMICGVCALLILIGVGVLLILSEATVNQLYEKSEEALLPDSKKEKCVWDYGFGIIMLAATAIYFVWSFLADSWSISWICFAVGGILCGIYSFILDAIKSKKNK